VILSKLLLVSSATSILMCLNFLQSLRFIYHGVGNAKHNTLCHPFKRWSAAGVPKCDA
jgi:hypothetical protein